MAEDDNKPAAPQNFIQGVKSFLVDGEEAVKKVVADEGPNWIKYVAVLTGVLAAVTGILAVRSTKLTNDAIYESSLAVLSQAQASDAWSEYQADSIKARIVESQDIVATNATPEIHAQLQSDINDLRNRQPNLKKAAEEKTTERDNHLTASRNRLAEKNMLEYASLAAQIGIALASVAAITRRHKVFGLGILVGLASVGMLAFALLQQYLPSL